MKLRCGTPPRQVLECKPLCVAGMHPMHCVMMVARLGTGGKGSDAVVAEVPPRKASRKQRLKDARRARQRERQAGSDNEDLGASGARVFHGSTQTPHISSRCLLMGRFEGSCHLSSVRHICSYDAAAWLGAQGRGSWWTWTTRASRSCSGRTTLRSIRPTRYSRALGRNGDHRRRGGAAPVQGEPQRDGGRALRQRSWRQQRRAGGGGRFVGP